MPAFVSARTSSHRLHAFDYLSGVITEQKFGAHVLAEASDAYALAYLDGTVGYMNAAMLFAASMAGVAAQSGFEVRMVLEIGHLFGMAGGAELMALLCGGRQ